MTPKQKLKSIEKKMDRIQKNNPEIDFKLVSRYYGDIDRYVSLRNQYFHLQFEIEHCSQCGKKI
jgi:hypothetical protein